MKEAHQFLLLFCLTLSACGSQEKGNEGAEGIVESRALPSDAEVLAKVYDNMYQVPDYFYIDERADTPRSYSLYHVKDISISYEICTDDYYKALASEVTDNDSRAVTGIYVGSYENDRYFEFIRELAAPSSIGNITDPTSPGYARIFKCSYIDRDGVDRNLRDGYAGILNMRPLTEEAVKIFSEYMWQFTFFWPARKTVLETFSSKRVDTYEHTLVLAFLTNQGTDKCDLIEIVDWVFTVNKADGTMTKEFIFLYRMESQLVNGIAQKCDA